MSRTYRSEFHNKKQYNEKKDLQQRAKEEDDSVFHTDDLYDSSTEHEEGSDTKE